MKKLFLLVSLLIAFAGLAPGDEDYPLTADSERHAGVPQGKVTQYAWTSKIFPGTVRDYWVYVPAQYTPEKPACVMVFQDGTSYVREDGRARIPIVFDNLIAKHEMPVTIAILIDPGVLKVSAPGQQDRINRSYEYDSLSDRYAEFLLDEILPEVGKHYNLSTNPNDRAISGGSSGGICSFTVAWTHPEAFRRVLSFIGSYTDLRGGDIYPALIRKTEPKPIRVFLQDGSHDLNNFAGDWWLANQSMASALTFAGYDVKFVTGDKDHDMIQGGAILPDALRWLWRDYPQPIAKPAMRLLGDKQTGFIDVGVDWEKVTTLPGNPRSKAPASFLLLNAKLREARGIAVDEQGNVFVADTAGKSVYRIDAAGQVSTFVKEANGARGLSFGPGELLHACDAGGIVRFSQDGNKADRLENTECQDIAVTHQGEVIHTTLAGVETHHQLELNRYGPGATWGLRALVPNGIALAPDQSFLYVGDPNSKWVWSYQLQPGATLEHGEPFFRLETTDEASASGAAGMAVSSKGLLYVATLLGVQVCDAQGRVVAIFNRPEQADPSVGPISGVAFGGVDHQYLYAVIGNEVYRRRMATKMAAP